MRATASIAAVLLALSISCAGRPRTHDAAAPAGPQLVSSAQCGQQLCPAGTFLDNQAQMKVTAHPKQTFASADLSCHYTCVAVASCPVSTIPVITSTCFTCAVQTTGGLVTPTCNGGVSSVDDPKLRCPEGRHYSASRGACVLDYVWVPAKAGQGVPNPIYPKTGGPVMFVCRANWPESSDDRHPGYALGDGCHVPYGGKDVVRQSFEVLMGPTYPEWKEARHGDVPPNALRGGHEHYYDLPICRVPSPSDSSRFLTGKVVSAVCAVAQGGKEVGVLDYEVLIAD